MSAIEFLKRKVDMGTTKVFRPIQDRIIIEVKIQNQSKGGIIFSAKSRIKENVGVVLATGPGTHDDEGNFVPLSVRVGDSVIFPSHTGNKMEDGNWILRESEVIAVVEV